MAYFAAASAVRSNAEIWTLQLDGGVEYLVQSGLQVGRRGQSRAQAHSGLRRAKPDFVDRRPSWPKEWQPHPEAKGSPVWVNRYRFGREHLSTNVRFPSNTDRKFSA
jgi:hypothetical protein